MFSKKNLLAFVLAGLTFALPIKSFAQEDDGPCNVPDGLTKNGEEIYQALIRGNREDPDQLLRSSVEILTETQDHFSQTIFVPYSQIERCGNAYDDAILAAEMISKGKANSGIKKRAKNIKRKIEESGKENLCEPGRGIPDEVFEETKGILRIYADALNKQDIYVELFRNKTAREYDRRICERAINRILDHHRYLESKGIPMGLLVDVDAIKKDTAAYCPDPNPDATRLMSPEP